MLTVIEKIYNTLWNSVIHLRVSKGGVVNLLSCNLYPYKLFNLTSLLDNTNCNLSSKNVSTKTSIDVKYGDSLDKNEDDTGATKVKRRRKVLVFETEVQEWFDDVDEDDGDLFLNDVNSDEYEPSSSDENDEVDIDGTSIQQH